MIIKNKRKIKSLGKLVLPDSEKPAVGDLLEIEEIPVHKGIPSGLKSYKIYNGGQLQPCRKINRIIMRCGQVALHKGCGNE